MNLQEYKNEYIKMSNHLGFHVKLEDMNGVEFFRRFIDKIKEESGVILLTVDKKMNEEKYTLIAIGKDFNENEEIRIDTSDFEGGLSYVCVEYGRRVWNLKALRSV